MHFYLNNDRQSLTFVPRLFARTNGTIIQKAADGSEIVNVDGIYEYY